MDIGGKEVGTSRKTLLRRENIPSKIRQYAGIRLRQVANTWKRVPF